MKSLKFFKPALATTLAIVLGWLLSVRPAEAGYTVTLQQVGPDVVATGSGVLDLTGLYRNTSSILFNPVIAAGLHDDGWGGFFGGEIVTGPTLSSADSYDGMISGPASFGSGGGLASSGSGDIVGTAADCYEDGSGCDRWLIVRRGYVSGTFLSNSATYSGKTFATLGVTPGTYVWTWGNGANQNFTLQIPVPPPPPITGPPVAITNPATLIASFAAKLNGSVNPHGLTTSVYFQYGTTNSYGLTTAPQSRTGNTSQNISANISGLTASTTYHFRIVTTNSAGTRYGSDGTFTTLPPTGFPIVTTKPATNVATSAATLNGLLDPHGLTTSVHFQYGTTTNYGRTTPMQSHTGNTFRNIAANIGDLAGNTTYHFRIVATNSVGTRYGSDRTFTTQ